MSIHQLFEVVRVTVLIVNCRIQSSDWSILCSLRGKSSVRMEMPIASTIAGGGATHSRIVHLHNALPSRLKKSEHCRSLTSTLFISHCAKFYCQYHVTSINCIYTDRNSRKGCENVNQLYKNPVLYKNLYNFHRKIIKYRYFNWSWIKLLENLYFNKITSYFK